VPIIKTGLFTFFKVGSFFSKEKRANTIELSHLCLVVIGLPSKKMRAIILRIAADGFLRK
jgi:hypothetical protein